MNLLGIQNYSAGIRKHGPSGPLYGLWTADEKQLLSFRLHDKAVSAKVRTQREAPDWLKALIAETQNFFQNDKPHKLELAFHRLNLSQLTPFSKKVLASLYQVKEMTSYSGLAKSAKLSAVRAVATAVGKNPFPLYVPCHRIITAKGTLGEFSAPGGSFLKLEILLRENGEYSEKDFYLLTKAYHSAHRGQASGESLCNLRLF